MNTFQQIYQQIYKQGNLFEVEKIIKTNPFLASNKRPNSIAICGGAFGDEGKGRVADELAAEFLQTAKKIILYRDNGGSNAGHTVEIGNQKLVLHQLGSGVLNKNCTTISGKGMVIHPLDLVSEIEQVKQVSRGQIPATLIIDEMAALCLDTHRAFETALSISTQGYASSTGRGIGPAYVDLLYRQPVRMRDLMRPNWQNILTKHYHLYQKLVSGLGSDLATVQVSRLATKPQKVGTLPTFLARLAKVRPQLKPFVKPCYQLVSEQWANPKVPFVFEKAQAIGLDLHWSVYPDCTVSNCTFEGIRTSTEGIVDPHQIAVKAAVIKATYTSSVGSRILPSHMPDPLASQIRKDANEYGATTGRPRDIHYLDIPLLSYLMRVGQVEYLVPTHLDVVYPHQPIKVCVGYLKNGKSVGYRPDQEYLLGIKPQFIELPSWDKVKLQQAKKPADLPLETLQFLAFLEQTLNVKILMATTGPKREQTIRWF